MHDVCININAIMLGLILTIPFFFFLRPSQGAPPPTNAFDTTNISENQMDFFFLSTIFNVVRTHLRIRALTFLILLLLCTWIYATLYNSTLITLLMNAIYIINKRKKRKKRMYNTD